ncbi:MAG: DUF748 domain-containing protein [Cyclobacteriaceae bacterium]|nr:DUF748 domain-containing protein [Cyclobacteriaceae bacterium]
MTKRTFAVVSGTLIAIFILTLGILPFIIRDLAVDHGKEWFGRNISLSKFKVNYFTGTIRLVDFKMYEVDDSTVFVSFDTLIIDTEPYRLLRKHFVIEQLYLTGLRARVVMSDSSYNFDDLIAFYSSDTASAEAKDTVSAASLQFEFSNMELKDAFFTGIDLSVNKRVDLENIDFFVPYVAWNQQQKSKAGLKFDFGNGGFFQSDIDIDPIGGDFIANMIIDELDLSGYSDYATKFINLGKFAGRTDIHLKLVGNINRPGEAIASGIVEVNDFSLLDHKQEPLVEVKKFTAGLKRGSLATSSIVMDSLALTSPHLHIEIYDSTMNLMEYADQLMVSDSVHDSPQNVEKKVEEDTASWYFAIDRFTIREGEIDVSDQRTGEPFYYNLSEVSLLVDSITSDKQWIDTYSSMLLNKRGKLVAQAGFNPVNPMDLTLDYTVKDFMLSDLNIYSQYYMGTPILYGDMYYKAHTDIRNGNITSENTLIIHNVELGNKGKGLYELPLKFALFLLKDKDGVITLDIPVRGDLKDPTVRVGKIVWNIFKNLILKAAAAPGKLLAGLVGGDPTQIESINYAYLDTALIAEKQKQLGLLLELERLKPELEIELVYFNDPALEKKEIAEIQVSNMYTEKYGKDYTADQEGFQRFVRELAKSDSVQLEEAFTDLVGKSVLDSLHNVYSSSRISAVEQYLLSVNDSTQIQVIPAPPESPKNIGSKPVFEVKYGLKEEQL